MHPTISVLEKHKKYLWLSKPVLVSIKQFVKRRRQVSPGGNRRHKNILGS